jgi:hypothetical protein
MFTNIRVSVRVNFGVLVNFKLAIKNVNVLKTYKNLGRIFYQKRQQRGRAFSKFVPYTVIHV